MFDWASHVELIWTEPRTERFLRRFSSYCRLIMLDMRGVGLSDPIEGLSPMEESVDDVRAVMDAAGSERAALVGHGHGGLMGLVFAATHPSRTEAVVTINAYARLARAPDYPWGLPPTAQATAIAAIESAWGSGMSIRVLAPGLSDEAGAREMWAAFERLAGTPRRAALKQRAVFETDIRHVLPMITVPTLVVQSSDSPLIRTGHGRYLAEHIPGARYYEVASPDYWVWMSRTPDALLDEIEEFLTGARAGGEHERVLATVAFTDLVGSTELAARLGDRRWRELLEIHDSVARREVEAARGRLIKSTGDGLLATFDGPARGIRCVQAIGQAVAQLGLAVRAGLHTGEIELRNGDIGGIAVHIAARVAAMADGGQVLVSSTVKDLVAGSQLEFADRGETSLKGVPGTWRLYAVTPPGDAAG
jgi:class 3 adenylate cyclase/pimeloyl-ACP methyl ester carboxylesterase